MEFTGTSGRELTCGFVSDPASFRFGRARVHNAGAAEHYRVASGYGVQLPFAHRSRGVLFGRHRCVLSLLFRGSSAFDDVGVASYNSAHHEAGHTPRVNLRTQNK